MKNGIVVVLSVVVVLLSALYARQIMKNEDLLNRENGDLSEVKDSSMDAGSIAVKDLEKELEDKDSEIKVLRAQLVGLKEKNKSLQIMHATSGSVKKDDKVDVADSSNLDAGDLGVDEDLSKRIKSLIDMQNAASSAPTLEDKYSVLFDKIQVSDVIKKKLMGLLSKKGDLSLMGNSDEVDKQISELLGAENYKKYQEYEAELPTRLFVDDFANYLAENGHSLTEEQVEEFMQLDSDTVKDIPLSYGVVEFKISPTDKNVNLGDATSSALEENIVNFDKVDAKAKGVLDDEQKELFDDYLGDRFHAKEDAADLMDQILPNIQIPNRKDSAVSVKVMSQQD